MEEQQIYDVKDLRHIADEIEPGLNVYSQILKSIANRIEKEYMLTDNKSSKPKGEGFINDTH